MPTSASTPARRRRRACGCLGGLAVVVLLAGALVVGVLVLLDRGVGPLPDPGGCRAEVGGRVVDLTTEQAQNASTISAVAVRRGLPARAASIALATAYQESKLRNLDGGDRDSLGLFQQRPSQGWGTAAQIKRPAYAANRFYEALEKIDGYQTMRITEAAQKVQRSGFPEAYQDHAADARALASALTGYSAAGFSCVVADGPRLAAQRKGSRGLTPRADAARRSLAAAFGEQAVGGYEAPAVSSVDQGGSASRGGRRLDVLVGPLSTTTRRSGWALASYAVAHAAQLHLDRVVFDGRIWSRSRSGSGWRAYDPGGRAVLEHRDHVHIDVLAGG